MGVLEDAAAHLRKAREYIAAADDDLAMERFNAAASAAVHSGINSKDAICLKLTGRTGKADRHEDAVAELRGVGATAAQLAPTLSRLIKIKKRAEYQASDVAPTDARKAVDWAQRLLDGAVAIVGG